MSSYHDTSVPQLIINKMPKSVFDTITPSATELYFVEDGIIYETQDHKTTTINSSSTDLEYPSAKAVNDALVSAISGLPTPMQFKGTVGTSGTIAWSALPMAASSTGFTYKVITDHATAPICKVGDTIISNGTEWVVVPSGDEPSGTVTSVAISNGGGLSVSGSPVTSSGTITVSHSDTSSQASVNNSGRTYIQDVTLDEYGHVTGLSSATETVVDTNTTYALSSALSSHKFTSTLTAGGSGSGTSTTDLTLAAGSNITLTDDTLNRKITIAATDTNTTYSLAVNGTGDNANKLGLTAGGSGSGTVWVTVPYATAAGSAPSEFVFTDFTVGA